MSNEWVLAWAGTDAPVILDRTKTTFIARYSSEIDASRAFSRFSKHLKDRFAVVSGPTDGDTSRLQARTSRSRRMVEAVHDVDRQIVATALCPSAAHVIEGFLRGERYVFAGRLRHVENRVSIGETLSVGITTGARGKDDEDLLPKTYFQMYLQDELVGKALLSYENSEMADPAPTIELFEIKKTERGKGYGTRLLEVIEKYLRRNGFDRVWATDAAANSATEFWENMGFMQYDEEELVKPLREGVEPLADLV